MGKRVAAVITDMNEPTGLMIGNSLEIEESIRALRGDGPKDLVDLSVELAAWMLVLTRLQPDLEAGRRKIREALASGAGLEIFKRVIEAQGGDPRVCDDPSLLPHAAKRREIRAESGGYLKKAACRAIGEASMLLGAGRDTVADAIDPGVGIVLGRKVGDAVDRGDLLATLHYNDEPRLDRALARLSGAFVVSSDPVARPPLVLKVIE
jgi:thymidine phosphorylase